MNLAVLTNAEIEALGRRLMVVCDSIVDGMQREHALHRDLVIQGLAPVVLQNFLQK